MAKLTKEEIKEILAPVLDQIKDMDVLADMIAEKVCDRIGESIAAKVIERMGLANIPVAKEEPVLHVRKKVGKSVTKSIKK